MLRRTLDRRKKTVIIHAWFSHVQDRKEALRRLEIEAEHMSIRRIQRTVFKAWAMAAPEQKAARMREERLQSMRAQVASWLPDFGN